MEILAQVFKLYGQILSVVPGCLLQKGSVGCLRAVLTIIILMEIQFMVCVWPMYWSTTSDSLRGATFMVCCSFSLVDYLLPALKS